MKDSFAFHGIPLDEEDWFPGTDVRNDKKADLLYLKKGTSGHKKAMGVVHNRTVNFYTYGDQTNTSSGCFKNENQLADFEDEYEDAKNVNPGGIFSGDLLKIPDMGNNLYAIQWYNPFTGQQYPVFYEWSNAGYLVLQYPTLQSNLDHSMLYFKVWKWNQSFLPQQVTENGKSQSIATNADQYLEVTGIEDNLEKGLTVHPNPANNTCTITMSGLCGTEPEIIMYNAIGVTVKELQIDSYEITLDLSELASGIYTICLMDECYQDHVKLIKK